MALGVLRGITRPGMRMRDIHGRQLLSLLFLMCLVVVLVNVSPEHNEIVIF